jgi:hypothetical protein
MKCAPGEVHVWRMELDCAAASAAALRATLSREEEQRAIRFRSIELRERWTVARGALRCILAAYARCEPCVLVFRDGPHGKPALTWPVEDIPSSAYLITELLIREKATRGHFAEPWGYGLPWLGTLVSYPVVAAAATAIVLGSIGIGLRLRPLEYLGKISYGLYVYHQMCIWIVDRYLPVRNGVLHACLREVAALALTVAVSAVSYALLEKPFLKLKQRFDYVNSRPV